MELSEAHWSTLAAVVDRIVPADEWPSATQVGVLEFLRHLIAEQGLEARYAEGLTELGDSFAALNPGRQDALLLQWSLIDLVASQTIEGYYADPGNGGNRGGVAWQMVGFKVTA
ncbi:gluconate 2-dehydrogenase subunit 3 family protein [Fimbriimonas ginsengisoli]|uniref:Gluconate 2-dehydrogenase subunit 3 family protein n=1 Tax=Fimbriimonas ginsengisoli Gsoil 348 TaxID=661478 RepID=A0A068NQI5_FIMGI|nr:gluconate 2-dehydrogenase subunit 3 family protein [Fimbriimonas ginsengisoli]AIE85686.1 hypothetical protein OP10G_2318 [Fimbriimonas ginsengisoli Gsoil 348]